MGERWLKSVYSDGSRNFISNSIPKRGEKIEIMIRAIAGAPIDAIYLVAKVSGHLRCAMMNIKEEKDGLVYYVTEIKCYEELFSYQFYICTKEGIYYYNQIGISETESAEQYNFKILTNFKCPNWVKKSVFYQIFPDRFMRGTNNNHIRDGEYQVGGYDTAYVKKWNTVPEIYETAHCLDFYGGDLEGIRMKIPYLKKLGVNAIFLNPIFWAESVHRYDTVDYNCIDPHLGGEHELIKLVDELHENGIKIILDIAINHTSVAHRWFNMNATFFEKEIGGYFNENAKERGYYFFGPQNKYLYWENEKNLAKLNFFSQELKEELFYGEDAILKKWLSAPYNIDGWRFDCGDVVSCNNLENRQHDIWKAIRGELKKIVDEKFIMAEHWTDATEFLQGEEWDSAMNYYGFTRPFRKFLGDLDYYFYPKFDNISTSMHKKGMNAEEFVKVYQEYHAQLPFVIQQMMYNFLDSHDMPRLHTVQFVDSRNYIGAMIVLFTLPGVPSIYYGDEIGIDGYGKSIQESCRFPMPWWKEKDEEIMFGAYRKLCDLRKHEKCLIDGGIKFLCAKEKVFSYARIDFNAIYIIICSAENEDKEVSIDLLQFGNRYTLKKQKDFFDLELKYRIVDSVLKIRVLSHQTLIFELDKKGG